MRKAKMSKSKYIKVNIKNEREVKILREDITAIAEMVDLQMEGEIVRDGYALYTPYDYQDEDYDLTPEDVVNAILDGVDFIGFGNGI